MERTKGRRLVDMMDEAVIERGEELLKTRIPTILTNDPSLTAWGYTVIDAFGKIYTSGCIKTAPEQKKRRIRKSDDTQRRASEIIRKLLSLIRQYNVQFILSESPHGSQNASAAVMIGLVVGITQTMAECLDIPIEYYSEGDAKKCALGKLSAAKNEMIDAMTAIFGDRWVTGTKYIDEAVADSLGVFHVASEESVIFKMMKR